jgi:hypothetical protein
MQQWAVMNRLSSKGKTPKFDPLAYKNYLPDQNYRNWLRRQVCPSEVQRVHLFWIPESCMSHSLMNHFRRAQNELSTTHSAFQKYFIRNIRPTIYFSSAYNRRCWVSPSPVSSKVQIRVVSKYCKLESEFCQAGLRWCEYPNILSIFWLLRSSGMN